MGGKSTGTSGVSVWEYKITEGNLIDSPQGNLSISLDYNWGLDVGFGVPGLAGADVEVSINPDLWGLNVEFSGYGGPKAANGGFSVGLQGVGLNGSLGTGGILGGVLNAEVFSGIDGSVSVDWWDWEAKAAVEAVSRASIGYGLFGTATATIPWGGKSSVSDGSSGQSTGKPNTPRPTDTAIQTSRDIVAGRLVDSSTGKTVYADAIIRDVAAAKKKREQEIAAAAARQREHNRDRQDSSSSASTPSPTPQTATGPVNTTTRSDSAHWTQSNNTGNNPGNQNASGYHARPIVIDLDGDGVEISPLGGSTARFDYDGDGYRELTAWAGEDDGLLVYDIGNDGQITQTREVVIADWTADRADADLDAVRAVHFNVVHFRVGSLWHNANSNSRPHLKAAA